MRRERGIFQTRASALEARTPSRLERIPGGWLKDHEMVSSER